MTAAHVTFQVMAKVYDGIDEALERWIAEQSMFFVATAPLAAGAHVNVSPRGHDSFSVLGHYQVGWVDYTGSGVETIAHLRENGRICVMFCSFGHRPRIVRVHGRGRVALPGEPAYDDLVARHPVHAGTRACVVVAVTRVSDSCGYGVPVMEVVEEPTCSPGEPDGGARTVWRRTAPRRTRAASTACRGSRDTTPFGNLPPPERARQKCGRATQVPAGRWADVRRPGGDRAGSACEPHDDGQIETRRE